MVDDVSEVALSEEGGLTIVFGRDPPEKDVAPTYGSEQPTHGRHTYLPRHGDVEMRRSV